MDPFLQAREDMAASELGVDAEYEMKEGGPGFPVRLILSQPEGGGLMAFGAGGKSSVRVEAVIAASAFGPGRPARGDRIGIGSEKAWRVETIRQDTRGTAYTLGLARQD